VSDRISNSSGQPNYIGLAADIVSAFVSHNPVPATDLASLIGSVHSALRNVGRPVAKEPEKPIPAISIRKSVTPDFLISLEDGKPYKSLKRHLSGRGLTPAQYREKWGLPADYPMVAPSYAKVRSELAKTIGLGQKRKSVAKVAAPTARKRVRNKPN
jgi:predicted transcriptional regulator